MARPISHNNSQNKPTLFDFNNALQPDIGQEANPRLLMILDGHAMVYRSWFALAKGPPMTLRSTGEDVRAVYGFTNTLFKTIDEQKPSHMVIAFDTAAPTFRHEQYQGYKAHRPEAPEGFHQQVERVKQFMRSLRIPILEKPGYEADDIIGTISTLAADCHVPTLIFTGDTDTFQLVSPYVKVLMTSGFAEQKMYDEEAVRERYGGLEPDQQRDVKALQGDTSDNIPGVPGIGIKTAIKLIQQFKTVENLYVQLAEVEPPRIQGLLREHEKSAKQSKHLVTIVTDVPTNFTFADARLGQHKREDVLDVFRELGFNSLMPRIPSLGPESDEETESVRPHQEPNNTTEQTVTTIINTAELLGTMMSELLESSVIALDTETTSINPMLASLVGLSFAIKPGHAFYVPVGHTHGTQLTATSVLEYLVPLLENPTLSFVGHNINYDLTVLSNYGVQPTKVNVGFDTMIAAHLLGEKTLGLKALALNILNKEMIAITTLIGKGRDGITFDAVSIDDAAPYAGADADFTLRLSTILRERLIQEGLFNLFVKYEMPVIPVIVKMQTNGIALNTDAMMTLSQELTEQIQDAESAIYNDVGHHFNMNSPSQLADILFKELNIPHGRKTQTGYSTDAATLDALRHVHPVINHILDYRALSKLMSTYVETLPNQVNPNTGRIHTNYNQAGSSTGRIASNDPNLQNIPIRTDLGRRVRDAFVAQRRPSWLFMAADYSQIELRIMAHLSRDPSLISAFDRDEDIHASTASLVYQVPIDQVTPDMRRIAKVMNFGVIYGLSAFGIAQQTDLTNDQGAKFIETYFTNYPRIREWLDETIRNARLTGYVETVLGRRRYLPELTAVNYQARQAAERMAVNMPCQGTAAEIIKIATVEIQNSIETKNLQSKLLLQVHDELVLEVPCEEEEQLKSILFSQMPKAMDLGVPLKIDIKTGYTWGTMK
jgi:DNA polymerase-1